ncbi:glucose-6-phosphate isomerase [bacterium]|nr:glucose-6-phosphate isomerase [bacterium]
MKDIDPRQTAAWKALSAHFEAIKHREMKTLFSEDPERFDRFSLTLEDLLLDYSKNRITTETMRLLHDLAAACGLFEAVEEMFTGVAINRTEDRAVLHTALRNRPGNPVYAEGRDVMPDIQRVLKQMQTFADGVYHGRRTGFTGKVIRHIVNIGIGGSDLGPHMAVEALKPYRAPGLTVDFVSNVDGSHITDTLAGLNPEETLCIVASKTFTTQETMTNAETAKRWLLSALKDGDAVRDHFVALSTNREAVSAFGIDPGNMFEFWSWTGGRYSLWSAIGLSIACAVGFDNFTGLLEGGHAMDIHFRTAAPARNIPLTLALIGIWYNNFHGFRTHAVLPYDQHLRLLPAYLQQADMESNGKSVSRTGAPVAWHTGPVIWGEPGTNGQHAFFQLLHQGTDIVPADFLAAARCHHGEEDHQRKLLANFFAQTRALMLGKTAREAERELTAGGMPPDEIARLLPYKTFGGNRPTNSILFQRLTPRTLGMLIAMYEHKIFCQGVIWNIYSFDQWGVELGKQLAGLILPVLETGDTRIPLDGSTHGLIEHWRTLMR